MNISEDASEKKEKGDEQDQFEIDPTIIMVLLLGGLLGFLGFIWKKRF